MAVVLTKTLLFLLEGGSGIGMIFLLSTTEEIGSFFMQPIQVDKDGLGGILFLMI